MQPRQISNDPVVWVLEWACIVILGAMAAMICVDVALRYLFHWSWGGTDELGGFMLLALTYLSLSVSLANGGFHQLEVARARLSPRLATLLNILMIALSLAFTVIVAWQFIRFSLRSFASGEISNALMVPLWIPRLAMLLGSIGLIWVLLRLMIAEMASLRAPPATVSS